MEFSKKMLFVINPRSGRGQIRPRLLEILDLFSGAGYRVQVYVTQRALDAQEIVAREGADYDLIVCSGGDGTLNEVVSGLLTQECIPELGYLPAGSTNDFASSLRIPKNMVAAAHAVLEGEVRCVDVGRFCQERYFTYVAGFGAFTEVSYLTPQEKKNRLGHQAYVLEGVKSLSAIRSSYMCIEAEDQVVEGEFIFGIITNTTSVGGFKGLVGSDVLLDDGLFEVLLIRTPKRPQELSEIVSSLILKEEANEQVVRLKAASLRITSQEPVDWVLDGEFGGSHTKVQIDNLCRCLPIRLNPPKASIKRPFERKKADAV